MSDVKILEVALRKMTEMLDKVVGDCVDEAGKPKAPSYKTLMEAKGCLPPYCTNGFPKKS